MKNLFKDIPVGDNPPEEINVVVDIPKGAANKYEYDEEEGYSQLDRVLYSSLVYPFEYGFMPQTASEDGDSLDIMLLVTHPTFPTCVIKARPIGILPMSDEEGVDNKILAVPVEKVDPRFKEIQNINDVGEHLKAEIKNFFEDYKKLETAKYEHVKVGDWQDKEKAKEIIQKAVEKYRNK